MAHIRFPAFYNPPMETGMVDIWHFRGQQFGTGIIHGIAQSHPVGIIGPQITANAAS